ncbi:P-loop NTPase fold protein [Pedobacter sp. Leaf176]|uniref:KAP family P-loop NTPase fold protein n=1 Tax=Pedobacter sp. Leaf176 TaxID=1736286 RepID=UPI0006F48024|nr:P-loop NTPase fold protein [Pedobacter sp. Leaf176]KQR72199.1 hypothetical protein ASF92_02550 [Pedobacter sp. Leaf176]
MPKQVTPIENYTADRPIKDAKEDRFQRYSFSKRIAETIIHRKSKESIVFGLFGAWGEGKSSVLNFIDEELAKDEAIIRINLNPWRYSDEESLLINFFNKIAEAINKKLNTRMEKLGGFVKKYGSSGSIFGFDFSGIGNAVSDVDLEQLKERVDDFLDESTSKIVIFVDDIDRLDKQEIYTLFRLVKLTADFSNTTYILSFDEAMVAAAIGERFGSGDKNSGFSFLEKIIQIPLTIPKAQPEALKKFCFDMVNNAIDAATITLTEKEVQRFVYQFSTNILPRLNTPRLAVRFGNSLSFSLPLLKGEVNMVDLMLVEALKIFYPDHYQFIKGNADYFVGSYEHFGIGSDQQKITDIKAHFDLLGKNSSKIDRANSLDLISNLFPNLDTVYGNFHFSDETKNDWYVAKRIASPQYFDRYFSYAVIEGDISDVEFDLLLKKLDTGTPQEIESEIRDIIGRSDTGTLIQKMRTHETSLNWHASKTIAKSLCLITDLLSNTGGMLGYGFDTQAGQAAIFIYQLLKNNKEENIFEFAKELMAYPKDFVFAYSLNNWLRTGDRPEDKLFDLAQYQELAKILTERAITEAGDESVFEKFPNQIHYIVSTWEERDSGELKSYIKTYLDKNNETVLNLLKSFVPVQRTSSREGEFKTDINKNQYEYIVSYFDKNDIHSRLLLNFTIEELESDEPYWIDMTEREFTLLNMARQFHKWYKIEAIESPAKD